MSPGGYDGLSVDSLARKYINPLLTNGEPAPQRAGRPADVTDPFGPAWLPGFDGMSAAVTSGVCRGDGMADGVPVTYRVHLRTRTISTALPAINTLPWPGDAEYVQQLKRVRRRLRRVLPTG